MFDSTIGRWQTKDPKSFDAGDTNLYRYVGNHPSYATDPSGMEDPGSTEELTAEEIEAVNQFLEMSQELQDAMSRMQALDEQQMIHLRANVPHTSRTGSMFANGGVILLVNNKKWLYEYIPQSTPPPPVSSGPFSSAPWVTTPATYRLRETNAIGIPDKAIFQRFEFEAGERFYGSVELALSFLPGGATAQEIASGNYGSAAFAFARDVAETALAIGKIAKLGKLSKLRSLSDKGRDLTGFASAIMVGIEAANVGRSGTVAVGSFSEGDSLGGTIALLDGMKSAFGLKFGGKEFVEAALKSKRILAPKGTDYSMKAVRERWWGGKAPVRPNPVMPRGREYMELSHTYISDNGKIGKHVPDWIKNRSWNLKPMWGSEHALVDPQRYRFMKNTWKNTPGNEIYSPLSRMLGRMPTAHKVGAGVIIVGGTGYGVYEYLDGDE